MRQPVDLERGEEDVDIWQDYRSDCGCQWGEHSMVVSGWPRQSRSVKHAAISSCDCQQSQEKAEWGYTPW